MPLYRRLLAIILCFFILSVAVYASGPVGILQSTSDKILQALNNLKSKGQLNTSHIEQLVRQDLLPLIDADQMAMAVVGRQYWSQATPAQKQAFVQQFATQVINTYAAAFASYNDDQVKVLPLRKNPTDFASVKTLIIRKDGNQVAVNYDFSQVNGAWKVTDLNIENISLVNSYREQYKPVLRQKGLDALINALKQKNNRR